MNVYMSEFDGVFTKKTLISELQQLVVSPIPDRDWWKSGFLVVSPNLRLLFVLHYKSYLTHS